jgi:glutamyl-tRNA synthetase
MGEFSSTQRSSYRGRLAPSPTGYLHVGHARTFWTAYERSVAANGSLVMRMEDLDPDRSRAVYAQAALEDLRWLGIRWHEGPGNSGPGTEGLDSENRGQAGPFAPYAQSGRRAVYLDAWRKLMRGGFIYPCRCSRKDLEAALSAPHEGNQEPLDDEPVYPGTCRPDAKLSSCSPTHATEIQEAGPSTSPSLHSGLAQDDRVLRVISQPVDSHAGEIVEPGNFNWRFRIPDGEAIEFVDMNLGPQRFVAGVDFGDFVVWRRDGVPSYQLACVADDAAMQITEVVRGEDLLKSTARQILLYRAIGLMAPAWFHCRLVTDAEGRRLAKRHDALSLRTLRQRGFSPMEVLTGELPVEE